MTMTIFTSNKNRFATLTAITSVRLTQSKETEISGSQSGLIKHVLFQENQIQTKLQYSVNTDACNAKHRNDKTTRVYPPDEVVS